jgi:hypothetical protein
MKRRGVFSRRLLADLPAKLICLTAAVILFFFHRVNTMTERFFSVPLQVDVPAGLAVASSYPKSVRITLRGAEEAIYPILEEDIEASVTLEGHKAPGAFREPVRVERKGTAANVEPLEVRVDPQEITFKLDTLMERRVNVIADIRGSPAYGYELAQYSVSPQTVVIRGAKSFVQAVNALSTEEIDLTGRTSPFTMRVKTVLANPLLRVAGDSTVEFRAAIQETVLSKTFDGVEIAGLDLSPHLKLKAQPPQGSIRVRGPQLTVEAFKPDQLRLLADLTAIRRPGAYQLRVRPEAPSTAVILDYEPKEIGIELVPSGK